MSILTVGSGQTYATIAAAVAAASPGDTIAIQAGTYTNDFPGLINGLTLEGVGGIVKLVATTQPPNGKAYLETVGNTTLKNLDISGVTVPDANGAAIRYSGGNLLIQNSIIHGNQDGILGADDASGTIDIENSEFYGNGVGGDGHTHNIYIGKIATFTLDDSYIHDANVGHEVKSRAADNIITNNRIEDNNSTASYEIDLPSAGNATITGNVIQKSANSGNGTTIAYGEENTDNPGRTVTLSGNTIISDQANAYVFWNAGGATVTASNNALYGYATNHLDKAGTLAASAFATLAARPALDTTSPVTIPGSASTGTTTTPVADTTPPTLTVTESIAGLTTSRSTVISGTVADAGSGVAKVEVFDVVAGVRNDLGAATLAADGSWSFTAADLALGTHAFAAIATDAAGNGTAAISAGAALTVTAPTTTTNTPTTGTATPAIQSVTRNPDGSFTFAGTSRAGSPVALYDTVNQQVSSPGNTIAGSDGSWKITSAAIGTRSVNSLFVYSTTSTGSLAASAGSFQLASSGADKLAGTAGAADVFAVTANSGRDVIANFEAASKVGAAHDVIDLVGTSYHAFDQLQQRITGATNAVIRLNNDTSITLTGVAKSALTAADFRFS